MCPIKVLLIEQDSLWIEQLQRYLSHEPDITLAYTVSAYSDAIPIAAVHDIDVVLMDINLTADYVDGLQMVKALSKLRISNIIIISSFNDNEIIMKSLKSGAINYLTKDNYEDVVHSIRSAHANQSSIHSFAAKAVLNELRLRDLTPAERVIYHMREKGLSKSEMAAELHRSVETIKTQIKQISKKMNL